jgi:hypothetical protein
MVSHLHLQPNGKKRREKERKTESHPRRILGVLLMLFAEEWRRSNRQSSVWFENSIARRQEKITRDEPEIEHAIKTGKVGLRDNVVYYLLT